MCFACLFIFIASICGLAYELMGIFYDKLSSKIPYVSFIFEIYCVSLAIGGIFLLIYGGYLIFR